jgi:hypothetical protein
MLDFFRVLLALVPRQYARFPLRRMLQTAASLILRDRRAARLNRARNPEAHEMPVKMSSDRSGTRRFLRRYAGLYPRLVLRCDALSLQPFCRRIGKSLARAEHRVCGYYTKTTPRRLSRIVGIPLFACMSLVLMGNDSCNDPEPSLQYVNVMVHVGDIFRAHALPNAQRGLARPRLTGTDGSQTGIAAFQGNFTGIQVPSGAVFVMAREADCSLGLITVTSDSDPGTVTQHYEQTLHQLASLKTTSNVFANGCASKSTGISSNTGLFVGETTGSFLEFAGVGSSGVFLLNGNVTAGTLTETSVTALPYASAIATADLNGDGNGDLVVVNGSVAPTSFVSVMLGNPDGTFQNPVSYPTGGTNSVAAVIDDVNGDGKLDIISVSSDIGGATSQQISVLFGNGDGSFQSAQTFAAPALPGSTNAASTPIVNLITADVNGDGKKDIICSNGLVLLGNGNGTFTAAPAAAFPYTTGGNSEGPNLAAGDINNDGKLDIVLNTGSTISTWIGKGDGTFTQGSRYASINDTGFVTITDLDGDGNADIYVGLGNGGIFSGDDSNSTSSYALMGNGDGTFVGAPQSTGAYNGANLGDVNGDGIPDLISNATGQSNQTLPTFTVQLGNGKGTFTPGATIVAPASFTGTTSALTSPVMITNANTIGATSYAVADVNGDGKADLVFVDNGLTAINPGNGLPITYPAPIYFVALNNGDGTFATPVPYNFPQIASASGFDVSVTANTVQIADFNHDGYPDLIFTYNDQAGGPGTVPYNQGFAILTGKGDGTFSTIAILTPTYSSNSAPTTAFLPTVLSTVDLNGDGKPDLIVNAPGTVVTNFQLQTAVQIYIGNGDGTFKTPTTVPAADEYGIPVVIDFNKDGKLDLAFLAETSASQAELVVALGNGDGTFATPTALNLTGGDAIRSAGLAAADFNADGNPDLALIDSTDYSGVFYGNGDGTFISIPQTGYVVPKDLLNIAAGSPAIAVDLNKDGKPDILAGPTILLNLYGSAPVVTNQASTTTGLTASASTITSGSSIEFTATITPAAGSTATPTGTVTFYNGTVSLGTGTVSSSVATLTTSALTTAGSDSISATYSGDTNFTGSTSANVGVTVTAVVVNPSFALGSSGNITVSPGATTGNTSTISTTGSNGFSGAVSLSCTVSPMAGSDPATCSLSPPSVTISGATAQTSTLTITTTAATSAALSLPGHHKAGGVHVPWYAAGGATTLACVLLFGIPARRRGWRAMLGMIILLAFLTGGLSSCSGGRSTGGSGGSSGGGSGNSGTTAGTYTVTVTGASGSTMETTAVSLTVN